MPVTIDEYVKTIAAVSGAADAMTAKGDKDKGKALLAAYNTYVETTYKAGREKLESFDTWVQKDTNTAVPLGGMGTTDADKTKRADTIQDVKDYLKKNPKYEEAQKTLLAEGSYDLNKDKGFFAKIMDFLGDNPFTIGALAVGAIAGNALGLGMIGTILVAGVAAVAGGMLADKEGFLSKLTKTETPPVPMDRTVSTAVAPGTYVLKALEKNGTELDEKKAVAAGATNYIEMDREVDKSLTIKTRIYGTMTKDGKLQPSHIATSQTTVVDGKSTTTQAPLASIAGELPNALDVSKIDEKTKSVTLTDATVATINTKRSAIVASAAAPVERATIIDIKGRETEPAAVTADKRYTFVMNDESNKQVIVTGITSSDNKTFTVQEVEFPNAKTVSTSPLVATGMNIPVKISDDGKLNVKEAFGKARTAKLLQLQAEKHKDMAATSIEVKDDIVTIKAKAGPNTNTPVEITGKREGDEIKVSKIIFNGSEVALDEKTPVTISVKDFKDKDLTKATMIEVSTSLDNSKSLDGKIREKIDALNKESKEKGEEAKPLYANLGGMSPTPVAAPKPETDARRTGAGLV